MLRAARIVANLAAALILAVGPAHAEEPGAAERERLAKLLGDGAKAAQAKRWDACISAYTSAIKIEKTPERLGERGLCEEAQGTHNVDAYNHLDEAVNAPGIDRQIDPYKRYAEALKRVGKRVVDVFVTANPPHATILVNDQPIGERSGGTLILEPGHYVFTARLEGYTVKPQPRDLPRGDHAEVILNLERLPQTAPVASTPAPVAPVRKVEGAPARSIPWCIPSATPRGVLMTLACAGLATTVVSGATAGGLEVHFQSMRASLTKQGYQTDTCGKPGAPKACTDVFDRRAQRNGAVYATITAGVATGVLAVATVFAFALERDRSSPSIALTVSPQGGGIGLAGAW